jgi:hypothetical protein
MNNKKWYCLIYKKEIQEGLCLDINNERLGYFNTGQLKIIKKIFKLNKDKVDETCKNCPFFPYRNR